MDIASTLSGVAVFDGQVHENDHEQVIERINTTEYQTNSSRQIFLSLPHYGGNSAVCDHLNDLELLLLLLLLLLWLWLFCLIV
mmetsp:Transcript_27936/g.39689  ORF Transcript_27936/g.39689 Transcript_27936/m.39689 type:complete len:83 (+) Transcript_27936:253-501(+)